MLTMSADHPASMVRYVRCYSAHVQEKSIPKPGTHSQIHSESTAWQADAGVSPEGAWEYCPNLGEFRLDRDQEPLVGPEPVVAAAQPFSL